MVSIRRLSGPAAIFALTLCFFWKLAFTDQYVWFDHPDMSYLEIPRLQFQTNEIHRGQFPLWDPHIWAGQPLIGQTQPGMLYPFTLLFALLPLSEGYMHLAAMNWYWVLMHFQAALFGYLLARDFGRTRLAAILAGCLFSFSGLIGTLAWLDVINGGIWMPLVILFLWRSIRHDGSIAYAVLGGFTLGLAWLSGHHELPLLTTYVCLFTWLHRILRNGIDWRLMRAAAAFFTLLFLTSAVQTLPSFEFGQLSMRWVAFGDAVGWKDKIPYVVQTNYSLTSRGLIGLALFGVNQADTSMFFGCVGLGLALLGAFGAWKQQPMVRWLALVAALALLYSLGASTPFQGLFYLFAPILDKARIPSRAIQVVHFALAMLAAYGADWLSENSVPWARRVAWGWLAIGGFLVSLATAQSVMGTAPLDGRVILSGWYAIAAAGLAFGYFNQAITRGALLCGLVVLVLSELTMGLQYPNRHEKDTYTFVRNLQAHRDIARFLKSQPSPVRIAMGEDVPGNFGDWNGINMLQGYVAGTTLNHLRHGLHTPQTQRLYGITHWISGKSDRPGQEIVFTGEGGIHVFRNSDTMPRAWAVHAGRRVNSDAELRAVVDNAATFNPWQEVLMLNADVPQLENCATGPDANEVRVTRHHSNRVSMRAEMRCKGLVILADTYYPGWKAVVDGKEVPILETYGALRGIVVERGGHNIEMKFKPWSVFIGAACFGIALVCSVFAWRRRPLQ